MDWMRLAQNVDKCRALVKMTENPRISFVTVSFSRTPLRGVT